MLLEELDQDLQWRKKEILDIRTLIIANDYLPCLLRSCFTLSCAHFEGYIRYASNAYIAYIAGQKIECRKLKLEIAAILIRKKHYNLFSNNQYKVKTSVVKKALEEYENILSQQFIIKLNDNAEPIVDEDEPAIPTESNPKPDVLKEITQIIGLDYENMFKAREPFIDRELLNPRHNIVHGRRRVPIYNEVIEVTNYVLEIMETYKESVYSLAEKEDYLK